MLDVLGLQQLPLSIDELLHMPDGHGFEAAEVASYVVGQESINFSLTVVARTEGLC